MWFHDAIFQVLGGGEKTAIVIKGLFEQRFDQRCSIVRLYSSLEYLEEIGQLSSRDMPDEETDIGKRRLWRARDGFVRPHDPEFKSMQWTTREIPNHP